MFQKRTLKCVEIRGCGPCICKKIKIEAGGLLFLFFQFVGNTEGRVHLQYGGYHEAHNPLVPLEHPLAVLCHHQRAAKNEQESPQDLLAAQASDGEGRAFVAVDQLHGSKSDGTDAIDPSANLWQVEDAQEEAAYEKATA